MKGRDSAMLPVVCVKTDVDIDFPVDEVLDNTGFSCNGRDLQHCTADCVPYHII